MGLVAREGLYVFYVTVLRTIMLVVFFFCHYSVTVTVCVNGEVVHLGEKMFG